MWFDPTNPKALALKKRVEAKGDLFTFEVYLAYGSVKLLADALERARSADKEKLIAALESSTWSDHLMPYGPTKFVNGQNQGGRRRESVRARNPVGSPRPSPRSTVLTTSGPKGRPPAAPTLRAWGGVGGSRPDKAARW